MLQVNSPIACRSHVITVVTGQLSSLCYHLLLHTHTYTRVCKPHLVFSLLLTSELLGIYVLQHGQYFFFFLALCMVHACKSKCWHCCLKWCSPALCFGICVKLILRCLKWEAPPLEKFCYCFHLRPVIRGSALTVQSRIADNRSHISTGAAFITQASFCFSSSPLRHQ